MVRRLFLIFSNICSILMATFNSPDKIDYYSVERLKLPFKPQDINKKSILVIRGREPIMQTISKRESSKTTIQWKGIEINKRSNDEDTIQRVSSLPSLRVLLTKGSRWYVLQDILDKINIQESKYVIDEEVHNLEDKGVISLARMLGAGAARKKQDEDVKLTFDQEINLEILKQKTKEENKRYVKQHPEVETLLSLIYRTIFKHKPKDVKPFIANYVHYLNTHRDDLVLKEVHVPFDLPAVPDTNKSEMEEDGEMLDTFVRNLVLECANSAVLGPAYFNVATIVKSMIRRVSPSSIMSDTPVQSADEVVNDIMFSLLTEVALARTNSSELIVHDMLNGLLARIHPSLLDSTQLYLDLKQSVEKFIEKLLKSITEKAIREAKTLRTLHKAKLVESDSNEDILNRNPFKPILKETGKSFSTSESRVRFKGPP